MSLTNNLSNCGTSTRIPKPANLTSNTRRKLNVSDGFRWTIVLFINSIERITTWITTLVIVYVLRPLLGNALGDHNKNVSVNLLGLRKIYSYEQKFQIYACVYIYICGWLVAKARPLKCTDMCFIKSYSMSWCHWRRSPTPYNIINDTNQWVSQHGRIMMLLNLPSSFSAKWFLSVPLPGRSSV